MTDLDSIDPAFGNWLAGFVDGEGSFGIRVARHHCARVGYATTFTIGLRADDAPVLGEIRKRLGNIGQLKWRPSTRIDENSVRSPTVYWTVHSQSGCALLVRIFERFPLRAKKRQDFEIWKQAVSAWCRHIRSDDWSELAALHCELVAGRAYSEDRSLVQKSVGVQMNQLEIGIMD